MTDATQRPQVIDEELAKRLESYKGKWVAVDKGEVVGSGDSASEAVQDALGRGVTDPLVFRVSAHPERLSLL